MAGLYSNLSDNSEAKLFIEIKPGDRFFARVLDYIVFITLVFFYLMRCFILSLMVACPLFCTCQQFSYGYPLKVY